MVDINGRALDLNEMNHEFFFLLFDLFIKLLCMATAGTLSGYKISIIIEIFPFFLFGCLIVNIIHDLQEQKKRISFNSLRDLRIYKKKRFLI